MDIILFTIALSIFLAVSVYNAQQQTKYGRNSLIHYWRNHPRTLVIYLIGVFLLVLSFIIGGFFTFII